MGVGGLLQNGFCGLALCYVKAPMMLYTGVRHFNVPDTRAVEGGLLLVSNHQSFLDPVLAGMALSEPICYLARRSLFDIPGFGALIRAVASYPVERGTIDVGALRIVLRLLRDGKRLLVFPEGTRTRDGTLGAFKSGMAAIALRTGASVLPLCIEGAYACWPRTQALPRPRRVAVAYGELIRPAGESARELNQRVRRQIERLQVFLREYLGYE